MNKKKQSGDCKNCNSQEEKQIEELAISFHKAIDELLSLQTCRVLAKDFLQFGYRKQEWISVKDRLPEDTQMCLAYATVYFVPDHVDDCDHCERIIVTKYYKEFGFMDWDVHYWMPLPEAPKMKGGAE